MLRPLITSSFPSLTLSVSRDRKVLIANAATSALRLHQRLPRFQMTAAFLNQLVAEDSCHYLLYSIIFLAAHPITLVLVPLSLFASLHVASSTLTLLDKTGNRNSKHLPISLFEGLLMIAFPDAAPLGGTLVTLIERHQRNILLTVAMTEVVLMPFVILSVLTGVCSLVTPFIYSRFLIWRYASRRNPYTRTSFRQIRLLIEQLISLPACPLLIRRAFHSLIDVTSRMAPAVPPDGQ